MAFKIYTKTGDKGETSLLGGTRLPKHHNRIEAYGNVDELNSYVGLIRDQFMIFEQLKKENKRTESTLLEIQDRLFTIGSHLAADPEKNKMKLPQINEDDVCFLESEIDVIQETLTDMKHFVLPGGHPAVSICHIARCVCRRAERSIIRLAENEKVEEITYKYLNRLSDYLFVLSRKLSQDAKAKESPWIPKTN